MEEKEMIQQELASIAPQLETVSKQMPFAVPENYFETLSLDILGKTAIKQDKPAVPEGYFDALPGTLLSKIKTMARQDELAEIAPALSTLSRTMPFTVPTGYFENFEAGKTEPEETPVIPISGKKKGFRWLAAASVAILAGIFAWIYLAQSSSVSNTNNTNGVAANSQLDSEFANALAGVEESSITSALKESDVSTSTSTALFYLQTENFENALSELSEEEIKTQLEELVVVKNKS